VPQIPRKLTVFPRPLSCILRGVLLKGGREEGRIRAESSNSNWGLWNWQWRRRGKEEGQGVELGCGIHTFIFFHFKHCTQEYVIYLCL